MSRQEEDTKTEFSPMMTEQGREELYLYSLRKMAEPHHYEIVRFRA